MYPPYKFRRRFRIPLQLYRRLKVDLPQIEPDLLQKVDALGRPGAKTCQKILGSLRRLGTGASFDNLDDQSKMSAESGRRAFRSFCSAVLKRYGPRFLNRDPTLQELRRIERQYAERNFPGCIGALDCMSMEWKNCPKSFKGQYHNPKNGKLATLSFEGVSDSNLYCWHVFCGRPGTNNDITVAENSPLIIDILAGKRRMKDSNQARNWFLYFLVDGIYPRWAMFYVQTAKRAIERRKE